jgi:hypothetical protein
MSTASGSLLRCRFPDGSLSACVCSTLTIGRGSPACLTDPACSRRQYELTPLGHGEEICCTARTRAQQAHQAAQHSTHVQQQAGAHQPALRLTVVGANPVTGWWCASSATGTGTRCVCMQANGMRMALPCQSAHNPCTTHTQHTQHTQRMHHTSHSAHAHAHAHTAHSTQHTAHSTRSLPHTQKT